MKTCPCCGSSIPEIPVAALKEFPFGHVSRMVVNALVDAYPRGVYVGALIEAGDGPREPEHSERAMREVIKKLRRKLPALGWEIPYLPSDRKGAGAPAIYRLAKIADPK